MSTTHAATWRDLAGQLTPEQIAAYEHREQTWRAPDQDVAAFLLADARREAEANTVDRERFGHIPGPAGARRVFHWELDGDAGGWRREFQGRTWRVGPLSVAIEGYQFENGRIRQRAVVEAGDLFDADELRQIAEVILAAAEQLDPATEDTPYPVASRVYECCHAIGRHGSDCGG